MQHCQLVHFHVYKARKLREVNETGTGSSLSFFRSFEKPGYEHFQRMHC